jgi:hypothetical protein
LRAADVEGYPLRSIADISGMGENKVMRWSAALFAVLAGCSPPAPEKVEQDQARTVPQAVAVTAADIGGTRASDVYPEEAAILDRYLVATKGWPKDRYVVTFEGKRAKLLLFMATHLDDVERGPGGGKSRSLLFDPESKKVVRELALQ